MAKIDKDGLGFKVCTSCHVLSETLPSEIERTIDALADGSHHQPRCSAKHDIRHTHCHHDATPNHAPTEDPDAATPLAANPNAIERRHLSRESRTLLEHYHHPGDREHAVHDVVDHYNPRRANENQDMVTSADVYFGRATRILEERSEIRSRTIENRRRQHVKATA